MPEVFKPRRSCYRECLLCLSFFSAMLVGFVLIPCFAADFPSESRASLALVFGTVWAAFDVWAAVYLLVLSRESVSLQDGEVRFTHLLGERVLAVATVTRARWSRRPLRLRLTWPGGRETVALEWFRPEQRQWLIRYFRERLPTNVQEGWVVAMEGYDAVAVARKVADEYRQFFRSWWRWGLAGPLTGLGCGLALLAYAARKGVDDPPSITGYVLLDWSVCGVLVSAGLLAAFALIWWMEAPELDVVGEDGRAEAATRSA
jgi:hypothetical protein